ncbi:MAG TPA: SDR family NAD(P)-dependent oxidoreductase [Steroidobacteraceae bacterium]|jgi:NAD(P)-dependent dehydrogenase (short-subunit alcohol dehydrogenase family)|nr:SDR family NAD(P)-dependent oxidoreductase [Steroidobacteraceae bacterium]
MKAVTFRVLGVIGLLVLVAGSAQAMDLQLKGKTALVTGSTGGIGYGIAKVLLTEGAAVIINGRTQDSVDRAAASLTRATGKAPLGFAGDMSKADDIARLGRAFPDVDILINNVGRYLPHEFTQSTDQDWYQTFDLNVMSGVRLSRIYLPRMKQRNWGRIIFISSESALQIPVDSVQYGVSKAAQIAVARGIAEDCARTNITVNSILPGPTLDTDDPRSAARFGGRPIAEVEEQLFKNQRPTSIIKRFARTAEVASLVAYVASPLSSATTGAALRVDGGVVKSAF